VRHIAQPVTTDGNAVVEAARRLFERTGRPEFNASIAGADDTATQVSAYIATFEDRIR
jgi:hypothetical protein